MIRYVEVLAPKGTGYLASSYTYLTDDDTLKKGDIVVGEFGYVLKFLEVKRLVPKTQRPQYRGPYKVIERRATPAETETIKQANQLATELAKAQQKVQELLRPKPTAKRTTTTKPRIKKAVVRKTPPRRRTRTHGK